MAIKNEKYSTIEVRVFSITSMCLSLIFVAWLPIYQIYISIHKYSMLNKLFITHLEFSTLAEWAYRTCLFLSVLLFRFNIHNFVNY